MQKFSKFTRQGYILKKIRNNQVVNKNGLAKEFNVNKSTITRDFQDLIIKGAIFQDSEGVVINPNYIIDDVNFTMDEAFHLYTSAVLAVDRNDYVNPDLLSALSKLSTLMDGDPKQLGYLLKRIENSKTINDDQKKLHDNLCKIILAWTNSKLVSLYYKSRREGVVESIIIGIVDFFPYADGHGSHLIGFNIKTGRVKPFRFKRIQHVKILDKFYNNSNREDLLKQFDNSWKIWLSDNEPQDVILHFNKHVTKRVLETIWHKNQRTELKQDKSLIWKCKIAEPKEMEYWILGWGSNVEVINPPELRQRIKEEIRKLNDIYKIN